MDSLNTNLAVMQLADADLGLHALLISLDHCGKGVFDLKTLRLVCKSIKIAAEMMVRKLNIDTASGPPSHLCPIAARGGFGMYTPASRAVLASFSVEIATTCSPNLERLSFSLGDGLADRVWALTSALDTVDWPRLTYIKFDTRYAPIDEFFNFLRRMPALTSVGCLDVGSSVAVLAISSALAATKPKLTHISIGITQADTVTQMRAAISYLLSGANALKDLRICDNGCFNLPILEFDSPVLNGLEKLAIKFPNAEFSLHELAAAPTPRLRSLALHGCTKLRWNGAITSEAFPALENLSFKDGTKVGSGLAALNLPGLKSLEIKGVWVSDSDLGLFSQSLARLTSLEELIVVRSSDDAWFLDVNAIISALFSFDFHLPLLKFLDLNNFLNSPEFIAELALKRWHHFPNLTAIGLDITSRTAAATLAGMGLAGV